MMFFSIVRMGIGRQVPRSDTAKVKNINIYLKHLTFYYILRLLCFTKFALKYSCFVFTVELKM